MNKDCRNCDNRNRFCKTIDCISNNLKHWQPKTKEKEMNNEGCFTFTVLDIEPETCNCNSLKENEMEEVIVTMRMMKWEEAQGKMKAMLQTIMDTDEYEEAEEMVTEFIEAMDELLFEM